MAAPSSFPGTIAPDTTGLQTVEIGGGTASPIRAVALFE
jgi:hypothetical protein